MRNFNIISSFSDIENSGLVKSGLLFYEGKHKDNKGREWVVPPDMIEEIVNNTNQKLEEANLNVFLEHSKTSKDHIGEIVGNVEARPITKTDVVKNPKLKNLVGRLGIFSSGIEIREPEIIDKLKKGLGKSVSCGIDFASNVIRELSLVGIGSLPGAALFSLNRSTSLNEYLQNKSQQDNQVEELHALLDDLYQVILNINNLSDSELEFKNREYYYVNVINEFTEHLQNKLPLILDEQQSYQQNLNNLNTQNYSDLMVDYIKFGKQLLY
jgi:hypothetical protein